jgi:signal peptidase I
MEAKPYKKSIAREYFEAIVLAVILALFFRTFVIEAFKIPSSSMEDNLLIGDHILVNKFAYAPTNFAWEKYLLPIRDIKRTDVIVFKYPEDPTRNFIKRVIGLGNDKLEVRDKQVYINGNPIKEPYKIHKAEFFGLTAENFGPVTVPPGYYFAMGDNRDNSKDSRAWGFVPKDYIKGRAFMIYWSFEGPQNVGPSSMGDNVRDIGNLIIRFIPNTRWNRFFKIIR